LRLETVIGVPGRLRAAIDHEAELSRLKFNHEDNRTAIHSQAYANNRNKPKPPEPIDMAFYGSLTTA
jgi:hypothetical protein